MSTVNRQHRPTSELRAIRPRQPWNVVTVLPSNRPYSDDEAAAITANFARYEKANWRYPARATRRRMGLHGPGFQRLDASGRHVRGPHAPSLRPAPLPPREAVAA